MDIVTATHQDRADFPGLGTRYLIRAEGTDGRFALIEHEIAPRALAAPVHVHEHEDEYSCRAARAATHEPKKTYVNTFALADRAPEHKEAG